jgi:hypothetical protein
LIVVGASVQFIGCHPADQTIRAGIAVQRGNGDTAIQGIGARAAVEFDRDIEPIIHGDAVVPLSGVFGDDAGHAHAGEGGALAEGRDHDPIIAGGFGRAGVIEVDAVMFLQFGGLHSAHLAARTHIQAQQAGGGVERGQIRVGLFGETIIGEVEQFDFEEVEPLFKDGDETKRSIQPDGEESLQPG